VKRYKTGTAIAFLLAAIVFAPETGRAETADAVVNYALTDPATGKTGTARATATAVISQNMVIEYVTPMNLGTSGETGKAETLRLISASNTTGQAGATRGNPPLTAAVAVQGLPNQTFAVSINQATRDRNRPGGPMVVTFTHSAGQTPHIGPAGNTEFVIGASLRIARNNVRQGYNGTLDVVVSHN
jgi:hypothetical protein